MLVVLLIVKRYSKQAVVMKEQLISMLHYSYFYMVRLMSKSQLHYSDPDPNILSVAFLARYEPIFNQGFSTC